MSEYQNAVKKIPNGFKTVHNDIAREGDMRWDSSTEQRFLIVSKVMIGMKSDYFICLIRKDISK